MLSESLDCPFFILVCVVRVSGLSILYLCLCCQRPWIVHSLSLFVLSASLDCPFFIFVCVVSVSGLSILYLCLPYVVRVSGLSILYLCLPNVVRVSGLSILRCHSIFSNVYLLEYIK
jgi:hypothetical protein